MEFEKIKKSTIQFYSNLASKYGSDLKSVGQTKISQKKRFAKILEIGNLQNKLVLDVGCGLGNFYDFLLEKKINSIYWGFDITPEMIRLAKEMHPHIADHFQVIDIIHDNIVEKYDYVISVGTLNLPMGKNNDSVAIELIRRMYDICNTGIAISMTSNYTKKPNKNTFYYDPSIIIKKVSKFCQNLKLDHTYLPHDFTLFCYKKGLYDY